MAQTLAFPQSLLGESEAQLQVGRNSTRASRNLRDRDRVLAFCRIALIHVTACAAVVQAEGAVPGSLLKERI
jgi:hypothetical protein